jgi:hypothetical protein
MAGRLRLAAKGGVISNLPLSWIAKSWGRSFLSEINYAFITLAVLAS